jgi:hypothetical protein
MEISSKVYLFCGIARRFPAPYNFLLLHRSRGYDLRLRTHTNSILARAGRGRRVHWLSFTASGFIRAGRFFRLFHAERFVGAGFVRIRMQGGERDTSPCNIFLIEEGQPGILRGKYRDFSRRCRTRTHGLNNRSVGVVFVQLVHGDVLALQRMATFWPFKDHR